MRPLRGAVVRGGAQIEPARLLRSLVASSKTTNSSAPADMSRRLESIFLSYYKVTRGRAVCMLLYTNNLVLDRYGGEGGKGSCPVQKELITSKH